jgi:hypothetical protein
MADLLAIPGCTVEQVGQVELTYTGTVTPTAGYIFQLLLDGVVSHETAGTTYSTTITSVPNGTYTANVLDGDTQAVIGDASGIVVSCTPEPDPDPDPEPDPEIPGTATPPAAKYMAVGGTLSNPIEYTFAFQVNDSAAVPKTGHYLTVNIYREGVLTPFATTRQRIRNGAAVVDVARFVKALVSSYASFDDSLTVTTDSNAIAGFTIGFVEAWGTVTMDEVKEDTVKYAVNAALQSLDGNYVEHVIMGIAS